MDKCRYYDDGVGNGGYCSGMNAGPPTCSLKGDESCNGDIKKCNINYIRIKKLTQELKKLKSEF